MPWNLIFISVMFVLTFHARELCRKHGLSRKQRAAIGIGTGLAVWVIVVLSWIMQKHLAENQTFEYARAIQLFALLMVLGPLSLLISDKPKDWDTPPTLDPDQITAKQRVKNALKNSQTDT